MRVISVEESWVDIKVVAKHLGVNTYSSYRWIEAKAFPAHRVGRLYRFKLSEVGAWVVKAGGEDEFKRQNKGQKKGGGGA